MPTTTVRVTEETRLTIQEMARESKQSMQSLIARAVENYKRHLLLQRTNEAYAVLRAHPDLWAAEQNERREWDNTLADDLEGND